MKEFTNFLVSTALTPVQQEMKDTHNIQFCEDDEGVDWYIRRGMFALDTLKVLYDSQGYICMADVDANTLQNPVGLSVAEIAHADVPAEFSVLDGNWFYRDGKLLQIRDYQSMVLTERDSRMTEATKRINWLEAAQEDGDITDEEDAELTALRAYRTVLRRLDFSNVTDKESYSAINWPEKPE